MKSGWKDYLIFSATELKAVIVIGAFIILSSAISILLPVKKKQSALFYFDPNTIDSITAISLGFSPKQYKTVDNFRKKGGRFYKAKDIFKWYGVHQDFLKKIYPYVRIQKSKNLYQRRDRKWPSKLSIDINRMKQEDLVALGFVPPYIAMRIIHYRSFLGGFSSISQLQKVYGMNENMYNRLRPYLSLKKSFKFKIHWKTINYKQIEQMGIFEKRDIWRILRARKEKGRALTWEEIVVQFDLTKEQSRILKDRTDIQ